MEPSTETGFVCQGCNVEAPTKFVKLNWIIGAVILRFQGYREGDLCRSCINRTFWRYTALSGALGWWGIISFLFTPILIVGNVRQWLSSRSLQPVPPGAPHLRLTPEVVATLRPETEAIAARLGAGEPLEEIAREVGPSVGFSPGYVVLYVRALAAANSDSGPARRETAASGNAGEDLRHLTRLRDEGLLNPQEYEEKRKELVDRL